MEFLLFPYGRGSGSATALVDNDGNMIVPNGQGRFTIVGDGNIRTEAVGNVLHIISSAPTGIGFTAGNGLYLDGTTLHLGVGAGLTVTADQVALSTPGTISAASTNNATGMHTHAVTASFAPGASSQLLKSDTNGSLQLTQLYLSSHLLIDGDIIGSGDMSIEAASNLTLQATKVIVDTPVIEPLVSYGTSLGSPTKKFLTIHAAELHLETLVAQDVMSTIGGRILVTPSTTLIEDVSAAATSIKVRHNNLLQNNIVYLEADGLVEFMQVTSGAASISGGYQYSVTRNLDGSGANAWASGATVANTGSTGNGFIDLYAVRGVKAATESGPTIAFNQRTSNTFNAWKNVAAIGNLRGLYDYASNADRFGIAAGDPSATWFAADSTNGMRIMNGSSAKLTANPAGQVILNGSMYIQSGGLLSVGSATLTPTTGVNFASGSSERAILSGVNFNHGAKRSGLYHYSGGDEGAEPTMKLYTTAELETDDAAILVTQADGAGRTAYNIVRANTGAEKMEMWVTATGSGNSNVTIKNQGGTELFKIDELGTVTFKNSGNNVTTSITDGGTLNAAALDTSGTLHAGQAVTLTDASNAAYQLNLGSSAQNYGGSSVFNMMMNSSGTSSIGFHHSNNSIGSFRFNNKVFSMICHDGSNVTSFDVYGGANKNGGGSWGVLSDVRSKQQDSIKPYRGSLELLKAIKPVEFRYKEDYDDSKQTYVGVIAQDVQAVAPHMVKTVKRTKRGNTQEDVLIFDPNELTYALINAVRELAEELDALRTPVR